MPGTVRGAVQNAVIRKANSNVRNSQSVASTVAAVRTEAEGTMTGTPSARTFAPQVASEMGLQTGHHLAVVVKLNLGLFSDVTDDDVDELFEFLDTNDSGSLDCDEFSNLLTRTLDPPCDVEDVQLVFESIEKSLKEKVTRADLGRAITSGVLKASLERVQKISKQNTAYKAAQAEAGPPVSRDLMVKRIAWRVSRDDSFYTLPYSTLFIFVFVSVVITHLQIYERQQVQKSIEDWIHGFGDTYPGPYLDEHVANQAQMWEWLEYSGLPSLFSACAKGPAKCEVAPRSFLVGDVRVFHVRSDGSEHSHWLLNSQVARDHLAVHPDDWKNASIQRLDQLKNSSIQDWTQLSRISELGMVFTSYTEEKQVFSVTTASLRFQATGLTIADCICRAVVINPYSSAFLWVVDAFYAILIFWSLHLEVKQFCIRGCIGYWDHCGMEGLWNSVDLFGIFMGLLNIVQWVLFILSIQSDDVQKVLRKRDGKYTLIGNVMDLDVNTLETLERRLNNITQQIFIMQVAMGINVLSIMLKLFKAFGANSRLQLVSNTIIKAAEDLFHFAIVFCALFLGFALTGHILFGEDIEEFKSLPQSVNTAFQGLLGAFDWYTERVLSPKRLGSGMPYFMVVVWFYIFMVFVVLVMMNMLLAIVMDHYMALLGEVRGDIDNAPTLWLQSYRMYNRWKTQHKNGFIPNEKILYHLVDADPQAHPDQAVTDISLVASFPGMPVRQAATMMTELKKQAVKAKILADEEADEMEPQQKHIYEIKKLMNHLTDQVRVVTHQTCQTNSRLDVLERSCAALMVAMETAAGAPAPKAVKDVSQENGMAKENGQIGSDMAEQRKAHEDFPELVADLRKLVGRMEQAKSAQDVKDVKYIHTTTETLVWEDSRQRIPVPRRSPFGHCSSLTPLCGEGSTANNPSVS